MLLDLVQTDLTLSYDIKGPQTSLIHTELDTVLTLNQFTVDLHKTHYTLSTLAVPLLHIVTSYDMQVHENTPTNAISEHVCGVIIFVV